MKTEAEVDRAFAYAKAAGFKMIIGVPTYDLLPYTNKKVQEYDIPVAIHNHGPDNPLFPTPQSAYERIASLDRRLGLCMDAGHTQRSGVDPAESAEKYFDRLFDVHIKDVSAPTAQGRTVEIGRGVIDIPKAAEDPEAPELTRARWRSSTRRTRRTRCRARPSRSAT